MDTHLCIHANIIPMKSKDVGLREEFQNACAAEERVASEVLREFMRCYASRNLGGKQLNLFAASQLEHGQPSKRKS